MTDDNKTILTGAIALFTASIIITVAISITHEYNLAQSLALLVIFIIPACMGVFMGFTVLSVICEILKEKWNSYRDTEEVRE